MTDYSGLVERMRSPFALTERDAQEIANALEAQAKEIAELDGVIKSGIEHLKATDDLIAEYRARIEELDKAAKDAIKEVSYWSTEAGKRDARIAEAEAEAAFAEKELLHTLKVKNEGDARIMELEAALTPLADMDYWIESYHNAHDSIEQCNQLTVAEILAARAALNGEK